jgi:hypothetical protein
MDEGALVLVDCLGFRGIWSRVDPRRLIERLKSMEAEAGARVIPKYSATNLSFGPVRFHLRFLSDTIALSVQYEPNPKGPASEAQLNTLVSIACESASILARIFIDHELALPLRGCISFGRHLCEGNFLLGPAVDEAAEYMNEPEGAFIWLLPEAAARYRDFLNRSLSMFQKVPDEMLTASLASIAKQGMGDAAKVIAHPDAGTDDYTQAIRETFAQLLSAPSVIEAYPMPIRRGAFIDASVINPLMASETDVERKKLINRYDQFMQGNRIDIWTKRQNTLKFLEVADEAVAKFRSTLESGEY